MQPSIDLLLGLGLISNNNQTMSIIDNQPANADATRGSIERKYLRTFKSN